MTRARHSIFFLAVVSFLSSAHSIFAQTQDSVAGRYTGSFTAARGPKPFEAGVELVVSNVEQGVVKGTARVLAGQCAGTYAMEGNFANNKLNMKGSGGPCPFGFSATKEGNKLIGSTGAGAPLQLSK